MDNYNLTSSETYSLVSLLQSRPDLVSGRLGGAFKSHKEMQAEWERLAIELRTMVPGRERSGAEVKKKWQDLKYRVKKKAAELSNYENGAGGEKPAKLQLNDMQEKVISMIDGTAIEPCADETFDVTASQVVEASTTPMIITFNQPESHDFNIKIEEAFTSKDATMEVTENLTEEISLKRKLSTPRVQKFRKKHKGNDFDHLRELIELKKKSVELRKESNELKKKLLLEATQQNAHLKTLIRLKTLKFDNELQ